LTKNPLSPDFPLPSDGVKHLDEARKWSMFISILGFIGIGFLLLAAIFMGAIFNFIDDDTLPKGIGIGISVMYLIFGAIYFFPIYYLFRFSQKSKQAVKDHNSDTLVEAIGNLKSHYKFLGIMSIVMMAVYPIFLIVFFLVGAFSITSFA